MENTFSMLPKNRNRLQVITGFLGGAAISSQHGELAAVGKCPSAHAKETQGAV